jgi:hypothetical protein
MPAVGPFPEGHLCEQPRLDPLAFHAGGQFFERAVIGVKLFQPGFQAVQHLVVEPGADISGVQKIAFFIVHAQHQRAEAGA